MRARDPDQVGVVVHDGVRIGYEVHGAGPATLLLMPTWTVVHRRLWKLQVATLARRFRVVLYDGPGNGASDRPLDPAAYAQSAQVGYALAVLDATGTERAILVALSKASAWALDLAANHPGRVAGTVLVAASNNIVERDAERTTHQSAAAGPVRLAPSRVPRLERDPPEHWAKYAEEHWLGHYEDFLWFFFGQCLPEPHSTKAIEDCVGWGLETTGAVLVAEGRADEPTEVELRDWCGRIDTPVLTVHGDRDLISPLRRSELIAELTGGEHLTIRGGGHLPPARDPVTVNLAIRDFADRIVGPPPQTVRTVTRWDHRPRRVLYLSSPIGLGHARRDVAIAAGLRTLHPDVQIDWLAQDPVTRVLAAAGERVHPGSAHLASESAHIESEAGEHDLHCFEALRRMDEVLVDNFMVFDEVVRDGDYDLVVADEAWDVDHFLHENPRLKRTAYAWMTDFVGFLPMPDDDDRERLVTADYNAEMIEHLDRSPHLRDRSIFVGNPGDVVAQRFGPDLPMIREWTTAHYDFAGYVTGLGQGAVPDRREPRRSLGYDADRPLCLVTVGGSGVGDHLLRRVIAAYDEAVRLVPGLHLVVVTGPRIDVASLPQVPGLELRSYVPDLHLHLAACDLAVVQGGLTTCMELVAAGRPFVYVPLRHHFEQSIHVAHRLDRYRAGVRLDYDDLTPETLAAVIAALIGREPDSLPVETDGAARAAALLADLL